MRILFFTHYFPPEVNAPANRTFEHCREWVISGQEVHVITCIPSHPRGIPFPEYKPCWYMHEVMSGINVHRVWTYLSPNRGVFRRSLNYISFVPTAVFRALRLGKFDIIIATSPQFFCAVAGWITAQIKGIPWIFELRDLWPDTISAVNAIRNNFILKLLEKFELYLYKKATGIVCVTRSFIENLKLRGIVENKLKFIPNGVIIEDWANGERDYIRKKLEVNDNEILVAYIGTIGMCHGLSTLIDTIEIISKTNSSVSNKIKLLIVGEGAEFELLKQLCEKKSFKNVIFTGLIPHSQVKDYLAAVDISIVMLKNQPLFKTVLPSKMFESMAAGKPIILAVGGEAKDVLEKSKGGVFVPPENSKEIAKIIFELSENRNSMVELGKNGQSFVSKEFNRKYWANIYLEYLKQLL